MTHAVRNILLVMMVAIIFFSIWFLESKKVHTLGSAGSVDSTIDLTSLVATTTHSTSSGQATPPPRTPDFATRSKQYPAAKELVAPDAYINTSGKPITIKSLIGHRVILLDFWTYSCINCQRTTPYLNAWYAKYHDAGLEIIGVHSPEFAFEKVLSNVQEAVIKFGIQYPVILDSEMQTWNAYGNQYWPEHYLIDINGLVVDRHIGEGGYVETEAQIQKLLTERKLALGSSITIPAGTVDITQKISANSPETYFGSSRNEYLANGKTFTGGQQTLARPADASIETNQLYLAGTWDFQGEYATSQSADARIIYTYDSKNVYFVASSENGVHITVLRDGVPVNVQKGEDVDANGHVMIKDARLYKLISEPDMSTHTLDIIIDKPGLDAYTFTFG